MKTITSDKALAYLTLLSGLAISAVAIWYSVAGLVSIFAAAAIPIIIMGTVLELSKLVATVWLKRNWQRSPILIRVYLLTAIAVLMLLTSMGIFGFLSKAHLDQSVPTGDVVAKVALIDEKIKTEKDNIEAARRALAQMDLQVDQVLGRTNDSKGAERAVQIRRNQAKERASLQADISKSQSVIAELNQERAPVAAELRKVEAEVGPIKYIAALIYGDDPDNNLLEKAVRWVIIVIVLVFDPLAVILLLSSQYSFQWLRRSEPSEIIHQTENIKTDIIIDTTEIAEDQSKEIRNNPHPPGWMFTSNEPEVKVSEEILAESEIVTEAQESEILDEVSIAEKAAIKKWKEVNPNDSIKHQRKLFDMKIIDKLPWHDYLVAKPDYVQNGEQSKSTIWQRLKNLKK